MFGDTRIIIGSSFRTIACQFTMSYNANRKFLRRMFHRYLCKISRLQTETTGNDDIRLNFALTFSDRMEIDSDWHSKIVWGKGAHFHLNGSGKTHGCKNFQNCPIGTTTFSKIKSVICFHGSLRRYFFSAHCLTYNITGENHRKIRKKIIISEM